MRQMQGQNLYAEPAEVLRALRVLRDSRRRPTPPRPWPLRGPQGCALRGRDRQGFLAQARGSLTAPPLTGLGSGTVIKARNNATIHFRGGVSNRAICRLAALQA